MKRFVLVLVAAAALAAPASALAGGVVLKVERSSHLVAVAAAKNVMLVHTRNAAKLRVGDRLALHAQRLRNGTFAASSVRVIGSTKRVAFRGLLLARNRGSHEITVSAGGAPVTVTSTPTPPTAQPGSEVEVDAEVSDNGTLAAGSVTVVNTTAPGGQLEGHLLAIGTSSITVGSDNMTLTINVPSGFDLSKFAVGDEVLAVFSQQSDGTLLLTSLTGDQNAAQANQNEDNQGDDSASSDSSTGDDGSDSSATGGSTSGSTSGGDTGGGSGSDSSGSTSGSSSGDTGGGGGDG